MVRPGKQTAKPAAPSSPARKKFVIQKSAKKFSPRSPGPRTSIFKLYACEHQRASPGGAAVGTPTGNMLALMLPSDKTLNQAVKDLDKDFGLREPCRWIEGLKHFGIRIQTLAQARRLFDAFKLLCPDVQPTILNETPWAKRDQTIDVGAVHDVTVDGKETSALIVTLDTYAIGLILKENLNFDWCPELNARAILFEGEPPDVDFTEIEEWGWTVNMIEYDGVEHQD